MLGPLTKENVGGLLIFDFDHNADPTSYRTEFVENVTANVPCRIPPDVSRGLSMANEEFFQTRILTII